MKNIYKVLMSMLVVASATSCDPEIINYNPGPFVQVSSATGSIPENEGSIVTTVVLGADNVSGATVNFTVTSSDASRYTVAPASGSLTIPAGESSAEITLTPIDNFDVDGDVDVVIALTTGSSVPLGIGGEGLELASRTITVIDNDCPIDIDSFVGTYTVFENFTAGTNSPSGLNNFFSEVYQMEIALLAGDISGTKVVLSNTPGFNTYIANGTVMSFDTCNARVSFDAGFPTVALFRTFEYTGSTYNEADNIIQATGPLATFGEYQFTFTKQ